MSDLPGTALPTTARTTIGRLPERAHHERATMNAILDEGIICHVGLTTEHGPVVIPTSYARRDDELLIHGSPAATWLRDASKGTPLCVTVTLVDALVLARSAFHHSINYRSVVVFGDATPIVDLGERAAALTAIVEHLVPGRTAEVRPMHEQEIAKTLVLRIPLDEASVKIRGHGPVDDDEDYELPAVWAGLVPVTTEFGSPVHDERLAPGIPAAASATGYARPS